MKLYDVAIAGGGPGGCACAITLARRGCDVLLVDRPARRPEIGDALPPAANRFLRELGATQQFIASGPVPSFGNLSAWGGDSLESTDFIHHPDGHGWHVDRPAFHKSMLEAAATAGAYVSSTHERMQWSRHSESRWGLWTKNGSCEAAWLVDCTGRAAAVARSERVRRRVYDRLTAFVTFFKPEGASADAESATLIEASESGWWYTARLPCEARMVVYFTDASGATSRPARSSSGLQRLLSATQHVRQRVNGYRMAAEPTVLAANSSKLEEFAGRRWIAAGDAAAAHDPLASVGIAGALRSGIAAANAVFDDLNGDGDSVARYCAMMSSAFDSYLHSRALFYAEEQRWPGDQFWVSRTIQRPVISSLR